MVLFNTHHMNLAAYIIYLLITYVITVHVGLVFYRNGRKYILRLLHNDNRLTDAINNMLLTGYYLLNFGYAAVMIHFWKTVNDWAGLVGSICTMTGRILLTLAIIHFFNMAAIFLISRRHHRTVNNKT